METGLGARITVAEGRVTKIEREVPRSRRELYKGISERKYVEVKESDPKDRFFFTAAYDLDAKDWSEGIHEGEIRGPEILGNPTKLEKVVFARKVLQT